MAYSTRSNMDDIFSAGNITKWSDQEGNGSGVDARVARAIAYADDFIDATLSDGPYVTIPFTTAPSLIVDASARLAAAWLYTNRGIADFDQETEKAQDKFQFMRADVTKTLERIRSGKLRFPALKSDRTGEIPKIVT